MRSRGAFDTVLKWGLGCVTCMIYMCKKAVCCLFVFLRHRQSLVLSPSRDTFFINRPQM